MSLLREDARRAYTARREHAAMNAAVVTSLVPPALALALVAPLVILPVVPAVAVAVIALAVVVFTARRSLSNLLAGLTLLVAQPYSAGERIRLNAGSAHGTIDAEVLHVGLLRTTLCTDSRRADDRCSAAGIVAVPNVRMLRADPEQPRAV